MYVSTRSSSKGSVAGDDEDRTESESIDETTPTRSVDIKLSGGTDEGGASANGHQSNSENSNGDTKEFGTLAVPDAAGPTHSRTVTSDVDSGSDISSSEFFEKEDEAEQSVLSCPPNMMKAYSTPAPATAANESVVSITVGNDSINVEADLLDRLKDDDTAQWLQAICVVTFDLEIGQSLEFVYPPNGVANDIANNVCFSAMPDSNSSFLGDMVFHFRTRGDTDDMTAPYLYGYVYFRQTKDKSISRGYFQKSVVLLTHLPYIGLFKKIASLIAPMYFSYGTSALEVACHNIAKWPEPVPGSVLDLPLAGNIIRTSIPLFEGNQANTAPVVLPSQAEELPQPIHTPSRSQSIRGASTSKAHGIIRSSSGNRLYVVCEQNGLVHTVAADSLARGMYVAPISSSTLAVKSNSDPVVRKQKDLSDSGSRATNSGDSNDESDMATPKESAEDVNDVFMEKDANSLHEIFEETRLGRPGRYQDVNIFSGFRTNLKQLWSLWELVLTGQPILVISPTPAQCSDAVLSLVSLISPIPYYGDYRPYFTIHDTDFKRITGKKDPLPAAILGATNPFFVKVVSHWPTVVAVGSAASKRTKHRGKGQEKASRDSLMSEYQPNMWTEKKCVMKTDKVILKQLVVNGRSSDNVEAINNEILRKHFHQLTEKFLRPLERVFVVPPFVRNHNPFSELPTFDNHFDPKEFMKDILQIPESERIVKNRHKNAELYSNFLSSCQFSRWHFHKKQDMVRQTEQVYRQARYHCNIEQLANGLSEYERVSLMRRIEAELENEHSLIPIDTDMCDRLQHQLSVVQSLVPKDYHESRLRKPGNAGAGTS